MIEYVYTKRKVFCDSSWCPPQDFLALLVSLSHIYIYTEYFEHNHSLTIETQEGIYRLGRTVFSVANLI